MNVAIPKNVRVCQKTNLPLDFTICPILVYREGCLRGLGKIYLKTPDL